MKINKKKVVEAAALVVFLVSVFIVYSNLTSKSSNYIENPPEGYDPHAGHKIEEG